MKTTALIMAGLLTLPYSGMSQEKMVDPFEKIDEKTVSDLRKLPRLGRTSKELALLWGKSEIGGHPSGEGNDHVPGIKKEHEKYFPKDVPPGAIYIVGDLRLSVGFYRDRAIIITFWQDSKQEPYTMREILVIAESLCRVKFPKREDRWDKYHSIYSDDRGQQYLFQRGGRYTVIHIPLWIRMCEEQNPVVNPQLKDVLNIL